MPPLPCKKLPLVLYQKMEDMAMTLQERIKYLEKENGKFEFNGVEYVLVREAELEYNSNHNESLYTALGFRKDAETKDDEDHLTVDLYEIWWEISNREAFDDGDGDCCDWDNPCEIEIDSLGRGYLFEDGRIV